MAEVLDHMSVTYRKFDPAGPRMTAELLAFRPDAAFIAMHGAGGEDGCLQGFLDTLQIPYVGSGVSASAICMNKLHTKWVFEALKIPTPRWALVEPYVPTPALPPFPAVAKPLTEGSSVGIQLVRNEEELRALMTKRQVPLIVEERIIGRELTLPVFGRPLESLPVIEIRPKNEFFDFNAKYTKGMTEYICPADISPDLRDRLGHYALQLCRALNLKHMSRIDVMLSAPSASERASTPLPGLPATRAGEGSPYFLEINTIPGMTETSLLPMSARATGLEFPALIRRLLEMAGGVS